MKKILLMVMVATGSIIADNATPAAQACLGPQLLPYATNFGSCSQIGIRSVRFNIGSLPLLVVSAGADQASLKTALQSIQHAGSVSVRAESSLLNSDIDKAASNHATIIALNVALPDSVTKYAQQKNVTIKSFKNIAAVTTYIAAQISELNNLISKTTGYYLQGYENATIAFTPNTTKEFFTDKGPYVSNIFNISGTRHIGNVTFWNRKTDNEIVWNGPFLAQLGVFGALAQETNKATFYAVCNDTASPIQNTITLWTAPDGTDHPTDVITIANQTALSGVNWLRFDLSNFAKDSKELAQTVGINPTTGKKVNLKNFFAPESYIGDTIYFNLVFDGFSGEISIDSIDFDVPPITDSSGTSWIRIPGSALDQYISYLHPQGYKLPAQISCSSSSDAAKGALMSARRAVPKKVKPHIKFIK